MEKHSKKVMIVDDEFTIRELVELTLEPDYRVLKVDSGITALETIKKTRPDLIILDIMMPKLDGFQVCTILKSNDETKEIPIIILTAKHSIEDVKESIRADCDEYITKPFEPELLKKRVDSYLAEGARKTGGRKLFQFGKALHYIKEGK